MFYDEFKKCCTKSMYVVFFFVCLFFLAGWGGGMFREGVKFSKSLEMADSFFKCNRFFLGGGE